MLILKPKASKMNLEIRLYPRIKALRIFKGRLVRFIYTPFSNILKPIGNLRKSILFIRYCLRIINKRK